MKINFTLTKDQETRNGKIQNCIGVREMAVVSLTATEVNDFILNKLSVGMHLPNEMGKYITDHDLKKAWDLVVVNYNIFSNESRNIPYF